MPDWLASPWVYWIGFGLVAALGLWLLYRGLLRDRSRGRLRCPSCWYDVGGGAHISELASIALPVTCTECGRVVRKARQLRRTRRHWWPALLAVVILLLAAYSYEVRHRMKRLFEPFQTAVVPTTAYVLRGATMDQATSDLLFKRYFGMAGPSEPRIPPRGRMWRWQVLLFQRSLSAVINDGPAGQREDALLALHSMAMDGDDAALDRFISHLTHPDVELRKCGIMKASSLGSRMARGTQTVIALLSDESVTVRQHACYVLVAIGPAQMEGMPNVELCRVASLILRLDDKSVNASARDLYLAEMIRRGGQAIDMWLRTAVEDPPKSRWGDNVPANLELVTALRRVEGKQGPLSIEIDQAELRCKAGAMPKFKATIRNIDPDNITVGFQRHGDNRGERPMRWRFEVRDAKGKLMPIKLESQNFGGISSYGTLKADETFEIDLNMATFMPPVPPGEYQVVVQYHDEDQISERADVSNMVITQSKPIKLVVEPAASSAPATGHRSPP